MTADEYDEYDDEEYVEEYDEADEHWDDDEPEDPAGRRDARPAARERGLALGFLALAPLLAAYEVGLAASGGGPKSSAEAILFYALRVFGERADLVRWGVLVACTAAALATLLPRAQGLLPALFRQVVEGALAALLLGPLLIGGILLAERLVGEGDPLAQPLRELGDLPPLGAPDLASAARVVGAAAYEELLFRLGAMAVLILAVRSLAGWLVGAGSSRAAGATVGAVAEAVAVVGSGLVFAAFHLEACTRWLGPGGEPWSLAVFTWRALAGMLLAVLFRWRGIGVAAWAHGLFNLALVLGAGPDVFL